MLIDIGKAIILGIVEGVTEFLPISSTGHLILAGSILSFTDERAKVFEIFIQLGAILSVVWIYRAKVLNVISNIGKKEANRFIINILIAFLPAALIGLKIHSYIKANLFNPFYCRDSRTFVTTPHYYQNIKLAFRQFIQSFRFLI